MANTQHKDIQEAQLHEMKGASTATSGQVPVANGTGTTVFKKVPITSLQGVTTNGTAGQEVRSDGVGGFTVETTDHGRVSFVNTASPYIVTTPTVFTKIAATSTGSGHQSNVTENTTTRLVYTGPHTEHFGVSATISCDQTAGASRDVSFAIALNGTVVTNTEQLSTVSAGTKANISLFCELELTTNDYVEVFTKISGTGNVQIYAIYFVVEKI